MLCLPLGGRASSCLRELASRDQATPAWKEAQKPRRTRDGGRGLGERRQSAALAAFRRSIVLTETLARVLAGEDVVAGAGAVHLLLARDVVDLALDRDVDGLGGV